MFHRHQWQTVAQNFTPPRGSTRHARGDEDLILSLHYGITTVTQLCTGCGRQRSYTTPGDARVPEPRVILKQPERPTQEQVDDAVAALSDDIESTRLRLAAEAREEILERADLTAWQKDMLRHDLGPLEPRN